MASCERTAHLLLYRDEATPLRSSPYRGRAGRGAGRPALRRRLHPAPLPDPGGQRQGAAARPDRRRPRLRHPDRPRCPPRLPRRRRRLLAAQVQGPQDRPHRLAAVARRGPARPVAPVPPRLRQADQPVDARPGGPGLPRAGLDPAPCQRRDDPAGPEAPGGVLEAGQALAHLPRPAVRAKKKVRDELIARAAARPDWVLGWQDETWWTRLAQPDLFAWAGDEPLRLVPHERGGGPEALACYGLLRADTGAMLLRFVEGRPVSQVTADYLGWLCARFAGEGKKVFVLVWDNASWHISKRVRR